jgi:putative hydrolase of the HAD superfamily
VKLWRNAGQRAFTFIDHYSLYMYFMPAYQHIFFDLDHTLWDFERCSCETLEELFHSHQLHSLAEDVCSEKFLETFRRINRHLWTLYSAGDITQQELRTTRFTLILNELGIKDEKTAARLADDYIQLCPQKPHLLPHAREVLDYLSSKYVLHIITNGFADVQMVKLKSANITSYFSEIVTSEKAGCQKPDKRIFDFTLNRIKSTPAACIMIGDSLDSDIKGAKNARLDHIFYNYENIPHQESPMHEIKCLRELKELL